MNMCFGFFDGIKPLPPVRENFKTEEKYQKAYAKYERKLNDYMDEDNSRRRMANSKAASTAGVTYALGG